LGHLALEIIRDAPAPPGDEACDLAIGSLLARLDNGVEEAAQNAGSRAPAGRLAAGTSSEIRMIGCISHDRSPRRLFEFTFSQSSYLAVCILPSGNRMTKDVFSGYD
jgi:hypothetical protein